MARLEMFSRDLVLASCKSLLIGLYGENITQDSNFKETPERMTKMFAELLFPEDDVKYGTSFPSSYKGMIILPNIRAISFCPHHFLPVVYSIDVAYICSGKAIGASKPERIIRDVATFPWLQEDLTLQIYNELHALLDTATISVIVKGEHGCMQLRGIKNPCANMITSQIGGEFENNARTHIEMLELLKMRG